MAARSRSGRCRRTSACPRRFQEGFFSDINNDIEDHRLQYEDQEVSNLQIGGDHYVSGVGSNGSTLTWRGSTSTARTHEDLRRRSTNCSMTASA